MRSAAEILFRLRQEAANLWLFAFPPHAPRTPAPPRLLPPGKDVAERLRGTPFAAQVEQLAAAILRHEFPLFGDTVTTGPVIDWHRDYVHDIAGGLSYYRRIPYLDFARAGDHKVIWELNRHQHLVILAQAFLFTGAGAFLTEIGSQLESWEKANPWLRGINWASALEVAFRALSWLWVDHLVGGELPTAVRGRLLENLYRHGRYLEHNLSFYFSPNTHLLGEAVTLHALGAAYPEWTEAPRWRRVGAEVVNHEMLRQVRPDGSHFEQSTYYHLYAVDYFLLHAILEQNSGGAVSAGYRQRLERMTDFLKAVAGPSRTLPLLGDDDGGRLFHPYGPRRLFVRATLDTVQRFLHGRRCSGDSQALWWMGEEAAATREESTGTRAAGWQVFADAGLFVMEAGPVHIIFDAGPWGPGNAGHSHADTLSLVVRDGEEELLTDPGTYTYMIDPAWRDAFRGSGAHNTVRLDGLDQAIPAGPFRWASPPTVAVRTRSGEVVEAECRYRGVVHRRRVTFHKPGRLMVIDEVDGPPGEHLVEQFWHPGEGGKRTGDGSFRLGRRGSLRLDEKVEIEERDGWVSPVYGRKDPALVIVARVRSPLPVRLETVLTVEE